MRDLFINLLEKLVNVVVVIALIGVVIGAFAAGAAAPPNVPAAAMVVGVLIGGTLYVILFAGFLYLGLGIYQNTRRTAAAVEELAKR